MPDDILEIGRQALLESGVNISERSATRIVLCALADAGYALVKVPWEHSEYPCSNYVQEEDLLQPYRSKTDDR